MGNETMPVAVTFNQLMTAMDAVEPELARRDPAAFANARSNGGTMALLSKHPDLQQEFQQRLSEANRPKPLKVKVGDWVTINGWSSGESEWSTSGRHGADRTRAH